MYLKNKSSELRKKFSSKEIIRIVGAHDGLGAKLISESNFDGVWASGLEISASHGLPDANILTMTEYLERSSEMNEASNLPVIADCDTGFGGPSNVSHLVKKYESAGIAAICIEDKIFPKQNSLLEDGKQELLSEKDFVAKIIAGKTAKNNPDFMIIARIEALIAGHGIEEALKRATAYENAGADAILIHSKKNSPDEVFEFCNSWNGNIPIIAIPTTYPTVTIDELQNNNIKMVIYANQSLRVAHWAMTEHLKQLSSAKSLSEVKSNMTTMDKIFHLQEMYEIKKQEANIEKDLKKMGYIN